MALSASHTWAPSRQIRSNWSRHLVTPRRFGAPTIAAERSWADRFDGHGVSHVQCSLPISMYRFSEGCRDFCLTEGLLDRNKYQCSKKDTWSQRDLSSFVADSICYFCQYLLRVRKTIWDMSDLPRRESVVWYFNVAIPWFHFLYCETPDQW